MTGADALPADKTGTFMPEKPPDCPGMEKVEELFRKNIEFDSIEDLSQAAGERPGRPELDAIVGRLARSNRVIADRDGTLTWIDTGGSDILNAAFEGAQTEVDVVAEILNDDLLTSYRALESKITQAVLALSIGPLQQIRALADIKPDASG